jgi:hypothetical protein
MAEWSMAVVLKTHWNRQPATILGLHGQQEVAKLVPDSPPLRKRLCVSDLQVVIISL